RAQSSFGRRERHLSKARGYQSLQAARKLSSGTSEISKGNGMDINRFTEKAQEAVKSAQTLATRYGNQQIQVEHLLLALLEQQGGLVPSTLTPPGVNLDVLQPTIERGIDCLPTVNGPRRPVDRHDLTETLSQVVARD